MHKNCGEFRNCEIVRIRDLSYNLRGIQYGCILFLLSGCGSEVTRWRIAGFEPVAAKVVSAKGAALHTARASVPSFLWSYHFYNANKTPFDYSFNLQSLFWSYTRHGHTQQSVFHTYVQTWSLSDLHARILAL